MNRSKNPAAIILTGIVLQLACSNNASTTSASMEKTTTTKQFNPVVYFEIPVSDMERAVKFYTAVFHFSFTKEIIDNNEMALFPFVEEHTGISGALAKGAIYRPTKDGVVIYFKTENIQATLQEATAKGGKILYPVTNNGVGLVAEFEDTEGNRIALYQTTE